MNEELREKTNKRAESIFSFCNEMHDHVDSLYELMMDGTDMEEKDHIESMIKTLKELNLDRI